MACRTVGLVAIVGAFAAAAASGCRRSPLANHDGAVDPAGDGPSRGEGGPGPQDAHAETGGEAPSVDGEAGDLSTATDAPADTTVDTPIDSPADTLQDAPVDLPVETVSPDALAEDAPVDRAGDGGGDARPEDQPCGPQGFHCAPFTCDVAIGMCKTVCFTDDDCFERSPCRQGICGNRNLIACMSNGECISRFCAQGVCCQSACNQVCYSCALAASTGSCQLVPAGNADPEMRCPAGNVCDGRGQCVPGSCTVDTDCGRYHSCFDGHCNSCLATCASSADCVAPSVCHDNNGCTRCGPADAGAD